MIKYKLTCVYMIVCGLVCTNALADQQFLHGYISQAMVVSEDNPFYVDETGTHFDYREIGLNGTWQFNNDIRLSGQLLSRKAGDISNGDPKVDFLLLDYSLYSSDNQTSGIRLGRVKNQYGIYNATRDVPHVRPGVFVPQSVYFETLRNALLSVDGLNLYLSFQNALGDVSVDLYGGKARIDDQALEYQIYTKDIEGEFNEVDSLGLKLGLAPSAAPNLTLALTLLDISMSLQDAPVFTPMEQFQAAAVLAADPTAFTRYITSQHVDSLLTLVSMQYNWDAWVLTAEFLDIDTRVSRTEVLYQPVAPESTTSNAYYLQAEWLGSEKLSIYARHEKLYYDVDDKDGTQFAARSGGNPIAQHTIANTVGMRWYFTPDLSLTGEYSRNKGTAFINGAVNIDYSQLKENWDLFILQLSYHF